MAFEVQTDTLFERIFRHFKLTIVKHGLLAIEIRENISSTPK